MFSHELFYSLIIQRQQSILDILNDLDIDLDNKLKEGNLQALGDDHEESDFRDSQSFGKGLNSLFASLISFRSDNGSSSVNENKSSNRAVNIEHIKISADQSQFMSEFQKKQR